MRGPNPASSRVFAYTDCPLRELDMFESSFDVFDDASNSPSNASNGAADNAGASSFPFSTANWPCFLHHISPVIFRRRARDDDHLDC